MQKPDFETLILRLESRIQYTFRDKKQIQLALTHRSFSGLDARSLDNNQRL